MRIIAGELKGRKLAFVSNELIRPTQDRVRESVFNIIAAFVPGKKVLDLYAGTGAYGIEAISRGAVQSVFVDKNEISCKLIGDNLNSLNIKEKGKIIKDDCLRAIKRINDRKQKFDIVFLDPPYQKGLSKKTLIKLIQYDIMSHNNIIIMEYGAEDSLPEHIEGVKLLKKRKFSEKLVSFYTKTI